MSRRRGCSAVRDGSERISRIALDTQRLLTHLSAVYFVFAVGVGASVEGVGAMVKDRTRWRVVFGRLGLWTAAALAVCLPYYARSLSIILHVLHEHDRKYGSSAGFWELMVFLSRIKHCFFLNWYQIAAEVGLVIALGLAALRPVVRVYLVAVVIGYAGIVNFPQAHDRYLLPLVPLLGVFALAPLGLLVVGTRWRLPRELLAISLGLLAASWGLTYSAGAFVRGGPSPTLRDAEGPKVLAPESPREAVIASLLDGPARRPWSAPFPHDGPDCVSAMVHALEAAEAGFPATGMGSPLPRLLVMGPGSAPNVYEAEIVVHGLRVDVATRPVLACDRPRCYVVLTPGAVMADRLTAAGYTPSHPPSPDAASFWTFGAAEISLP